MPKEKTLFFLLQEAASRVPNYNRSKAIEVIDDDYEMYTIDVDAGEDYTPPVFKEELRQLAQEHGTLLEAMSINGINVGQQYIWRKHILTVEFFANEDQRTKVIVTYDNDLSYVSHFSNIDNFHDHATLIHD